jgi:hypothetical protein
MHTHHSASDANPLKKRETIDDLGHLKSTALHRKRTPIGTMDREDLTNPRDGRGPLRKKDDQSSR